jgi:hypothetical protein
MMKITIENSGETTTYPSAPSSSTPMPAASEPQNGGAPDDVGGGNMATGNDAGAPPQWLLDSVNRAMSEKGATYPAGGGEGGAGPQ